MTGRDVLLYYLDEVQQEWVPFACTRSHEIGVDADELEVSGPRSSKWREFLAGREDWTVRFGYLVLANSQLKDALKVGNTYRVCLKERGTDNSAGLEGEGFIRSCVITATDGNIVQGSFSIRGSGPLE